MGRYVSSPLSNSLRLEVSSDVIRLTEGTLAQWLRPYPTMATTAPKAAKIRSAAAERDTTLHPEGD